MTPEHLGNTTLLIAGPRAGKTSQLLKWRDSCRLPTQYFRVTPEDAESAFALRRLLRDWPAIRTRYDSLRAELPAASWGAVLGLAIEEAEPDFCLLLDDFHLTECMPDAAEWCALLRHFPTSGTLVVASRHQLPECGRASLVVRGADDTAWTESPSFEDLVTLPPALLTQALILHVVGESGASLAGHELVRRNVACLATDGTLRLRPSWYAAAEAVTSSHAEAANLWPEIEQALEAFIRRHLRTHRELEAPRILERIPSGYRQRSAYLLQVEGDQLQLDNRFEAARACYVDALALTTDSARRRELHVRLLAVAMLLLDVLESMRLFAVLAAEPEVEPHLRAQILYWQGIELLREGHLSEAHDTLLRVLAVPASGDRPVINQHARALRRLIGLQGDQYLLTEAIVYADRLVALSESYHLELDVLSAHALRMTCHMLDESKAIPFQLLLGIPDQAFRDPGHRTLNYYLTSIGAHAFRVKQYELALHLFELVHAHAAAHNLRIRLQTAKYWLILILGRLDSLERAQALYAELRAHPTEEADASLTPFMWAHLMIVVGCLDEAERLLSEGTWTNPTERVIGGLYLAWLRIRRGDESAIEEARAIMATPEGARIADSEAELIRNLGLRDIPPIFHLRAFGETTFLRVGTSAPHWPRKKALAFLALLALYPEGLETQEVLDQIYRGSENSDPAGALRNLAYQLRQVLTPLGGADLLEHQRGVYRFRWDKVAHCDLHEFDALYRKGQSLEAAGNEKMAAVFYRLALLTAQGPLFEGLGEEVFEAPRREYAARRAHAASFALSQGPRGWADEGLAYPTR